MRMESNFRDQMIKSGSKKSAHEYLTEHDGDFEVWYNNAGYYTFEKGSSGLFVRTMGNLLVFMVRVIVRTQAISL